PIRASKERRMPSLRAAGLKVIPRISTSREDTDCTTYGLLVFTLRSEASRQNLLACSLNRVIGLSRDSARTHATSCGACRCAFLDYGGHGEPPQRGHGWIRERVGHPERPTNRTPCHPHPCPSR